MTQFTIPGQYDWPTDQEDDAVARSIDNPNPRIKTPSMPAYDTPPTTAPPLVAAPTQGSGNIYSDWTKFVGDKGYQGSQGRTKLPQYVDEFNQIYGHSAQVGNPNASGTTDSIDFGNGWYDVIKGGTDEWQMLAPDQQGGGGSFSSGPISRIDINSLAGPARAPYVPGARSAPVPSVFDSSNPTEQSYQDLLGRLRGISTGSTPESANPNLQINPRTDPIIRPLVDAYDAQQQLASRRYLSGVAERQGANANVSAETRHAAEAGAQATSAYQGELGRQELAARRQEVQAALNGEMGMITSKQQLLLQEEMKKIEQAEQMYQFDTSMGQRNYEFGTNQDYLHLQLKLQEEQRRRELEQQARNQDQNLTERAYEFDSGQDYLYSPLAHL